MVLALGVHRSMEKDTVSQTYKEHHFKVITSETDDGIIMGVKHREYEIHGVQFHPEAEMTEEGHKILKNFIDITKNKMNS